MRRRGLIRKFYKGLFGKFFMDNREDTKTSRLRYGFRQLRGAIIAGGLMGLLTGYGIGLVSSYGATSRALEQGYTKEQIEKYIDDSSLLVKIAHKTVSPARKLAYSKHK
jgi:hypothetical protein